MKKTQQDDELKLPNNKIDYNTIVSRQITLMLQLQKEKKGVGGNGTK